MRKEKQYKIQNVGIDFTSLRDDHGTVTGTCIIYGKENGEDVLDTRPFSYDSEGNIQFATPLDDAFSNEEYAEISEILAQNIEDNLRSFLNAAESLTKKEGN